MPLFRVDKWFRTAGQLALVAVLTACTSSPQRMASDDLSAACAMAGDVASGETVVVMRDRSTSTKVLGAAPVGVEALGDGVAVVGPAIVTKNASGVAYGASDTNIEMRPCPPARAPNK